MAPGQALAGAWITTDGRQQIVSNGLGERGGADFTDTSVYWEQPLDARFAFTARTWVESAYDDEDGWRGEGTLALKRSLLHTNHMAMAVEAGAYWRSDPPAGCQEGGAELRWLGGVNFAHGAFVNVEAAARQLSGGCGGQRLDLTAGYRPAPNWLGLAQVFVDAPQDGDQSVKAQLTLVRFDRRHRGVELGVRARVDGDDAEPELVLGLWGPGDRRRS